MKKSEEVFISEVTYQWAQSHKINSQCFKTIESTNTLAKKNAFSSNELKNEVVLYIADQQTAGRGRFDRTWVSGSPGSNLMCTWSFLIDQSTLPETTAKIGLALINALRSTWTFIPFILKAPNDILILQENGEKKIAGLLVESIAQADEYRLIVGLGFNVLKTPEVSTATSLVENLTKKTPLLGEDWIRFLDRFLFELTQVISESHIPMTTTEKQNYLSQLNTPYSSFAEINWDL